ncbi:nuclear transport factor 2 family protein [Ferrimonas balearica]|uniref:nuclear transport factor 2 family protein n=1 Tax=Ferrimonas balearica TaxID=44012 RepID=UPI001F2915DA|nr:nuclear transport factor 2 family protein [Ferrimonas balearica]MBY6017029.1 nuclear transport factor 2 family protein [Halomonas denitrificans]MBY6093304.1 nuclear transport factor 2 family protein [Ferrimonas balearica]
MVKTLMAALLLLTTHSAAAASTDLHAFAQRYFQTMSATQAPDASKQDLEAYLALLMDDVGHTHLPWETDDTRSPDGKAAMRDGMTFYLGAHTEYQAELLDVFVFNDSAIAIRYRHHAKGIHPQNQQAIEYTSTMMELLEMENGKVAVIRKYHE